MENKDSANKIKDETKQKKSVRVREETRENKTGIIGAGAHDKWDRGVLVLV
jgi:hypothetical protein